MSSFPITPVVRDVQKLIFETFDVSEEDALNYAAEMVSLAEGWGSKLTALNLDWSYRIKKDLGEPGKLRWRFEEERVRFEAVEKGRYTAWDAFTRTKHRA